MGAAAIPIVAAVAPYVVQGIGSAVGNKGSKGGGQQPQLAPGFGWIPGMTQEIGRQGLNHLDFGPSDLAGAAGQLGTLGGASLAGGVDTGAVSDTFGRGLGGINEGISTGYLPDTANIEALLRPSVERSFDTGAADIREQSALTGNLSSSGATAQIGDYRAQLENALNQNIAGVYSNALPASMQIRAGQSQFGAGLPGQLQQNLFGSLAGQGLQAQQFPLAALATAFQGVGNAPIYAKQGGGGKGSTLGPLAGQATQAGISAGGKGK